MDFDKRAVVSALAARRSVRIAVVGDFCLDKYLYIDGGRDEPSIETGLIAYQVTDRALFAGAAGTIANNLSSLNVDVAAVGCIGEDGEGFELRRALRAIGADDSLLRGSSLICTPTYTKPIYCDGNRKREINRLDLRNFSATPESIEKNLIDDIREAFGSCDAMIVCDQFVERNCSAITDSVRNALADIAASQPNKLLFADSRGFIDEFRGVAVKCNNIEAVCAFGYEDAADADLIRKCGRRLSERNGKPAVITLGSMGAWCFDGDSDVKVPAFVVEGETDICGAGDSFNAGFALGRALGLPLGESALLANAVASITIKQIGVTGSATRIQVIERINKGVLKEM